MKIFVAIALLASSGVTQMPSKLTPSDSAKPSTIKQQPYDDQLDAWSTARTYAACVVKRNPKTSAVAVADYASNRDLLKRYPHLIIDACNPGTGMIRFPGETYLYALADALFQRYFSGAPVHTFGSLGPLVLRDEPVLNMDGRKPDSSVGREIIRQYEVAYSSWFFARLTECVVRADPARTQTLLQSQIGTPEEEAAFGALAPSLSKCLPSAKYRMGRLQLRGALGLAYVRLAYLAAPPARVG